LTNRPFLPCRDILPHLLRFVKGFLKLFSIISVFCFSLAFFADFFAKNSHFFKRKNGFSIDFACA